MRFGDVTSHGYAASPVLSTFVRSLPAATTYSVLGCAARVCSIIDPTDGSVTSPGFVLNEADTTRMPRRPASSNADRIWSRYAVVLLKARNGRICASGASPAIP